MKKFHTALTALTVLALVAGSCLVQAQSSFPGIENLMTAEEYQASGIDGLSKEQRDALNRWLVRYTAEDSEVLRNTDEEVIEAAKETEVLSTISGAFKGWSGSTVFKLDNGQVWQQRRRGNYAHHGPNPEIIITKNFMGFYRMELVDSGKSVQVQRIK